MTDSLSEETVSLSAGFVVQCSVMPGRRKELEKFVFGCEGSVEMLLTLFLTMDQYTSWMEGMLAPVFFSAVLIFCCSLFLCGLVACPNQTVMKVDRIDWIMPV